MAPSLNSVSESRRQKFFGSDSSQANLSSDTTRYITEFTSLSNELANIRREAAIASELSEPNHTDKGTTPQEREILGQYNQADGANRLNEVLQVAQARNFWSALEDGVRNDLTRVANNLGIDPTSSPPSQGSVRDLAPDSHVQDVQSGNETENGTSTLVANQYPADKNMPGAFDPNVALKGGAEFMGNDPSVVTQFRSASNPNEDCRGNMNCAPAALLNAMGGARGGPQNANSQLEGIRNLMNPNSSEYQGNYPEHIIRAARQMGMSANMQRGGIGEIQNNLQQGKKVIVPVNPNAYTNAGKKSSHYIVVEDISDGMATIKDALIGRIRMPVELLEKAMSSLPDHLKQYNNSIIALDGEGTIPSKGSDNPSTITEFSRQNSGSESEPYRPGIDEDNKDKNEIISDGKREPDLDQYTIKKEEKEKLGMNDRSQ